MTDTAISAAPAPGALPAIVLWPAFGPAHFPRPGKWPVMPVARCGAALKPTGSSIATRPRTCRRLARTAQAAPAGQVMNVAGGRLPALVQRRRPGREAGRRRELGPAVRASDVGVRRPLP